MMRWLILLAAFVLGPAWAQCAAVAGCRYDMRGAVLHATYRTYTLNCAAMSIGTQEAFSNWCAAYYIPLIDLKAGDKLLVTSSAQLIFREPVAIFVGSHVSFWRDNNDHGPYGEVVSQYKGEDMAAQNNIPYKILQHSSVVNVPHDCPSGCALIMWVYARSNGNEGRTVTLSNYQGEMNVLHFSR